MDVHGHTIFCEDFRQEASGQFMLSGCFPNDIITSSTLPAFVPRFCIITYLYIKKTIRPKSIALQVYFDDTSEAPDLVVPISVNNDQWDAGGVLNKKGEPIYLRIQNNIIMNGFQFGGQSDLVVRSDCDGLLTRVGKIKILSSSPENGLSANIQSMPMEIIDPKV